MAKMKFPAEFSKKCDMNKVALEVFRPWVTKKVSGYVGMEDDILINMVMAELEAEQVPDPRLIQINRKGAATLISVMLEVPCACWSIRCCHLCR